MNKITGKNTGFSIIEVIVVLIIVGVLAAVAIPNLFANITKSQAEEAFQAMSAYKAEAMACIVAHHGTDGSGNDIATQTCSGLYWMENPSPPPFNIQVQGTAGLTTPPTVHFTFQTTVGGVQFNIAEYPNPMGTDYDSFISMYSPDVTTGAPFTCHDGGKYKGVCGGG